MYGVSIIIFFMIIALFGNIFFNNQETTNSEIEIDNKYLPQGYIIGYIWVMIFGILGYIYSNINTRKDTKYINRMSIMFFIALCLMYGPITYGKSSRFIKNYNYAAFISLCILTYILNKNVKKCLLYLVPLYIWIGYVSLLTLFDDLNIVNLYIN